MACVQATKDGVEAWHITIAPSEWNQDADYSTKGNLPYGADGIVEICKTDL